MGISPFLDKSVPLNERDIITEDFSARVRTGSYGKGNTIKVSGVTDSLAAISKTIELAEQPSQLYWAGQKYQLFIEHAVERFRRANPPSVSQLSVSVTLPHQAYTGGIAPPDPFIRRI